MNEEKSPNPFASPVVATAASIPEYDPDTEIREFNFGKSLLKWMLICVISGAPSFFYGMVLGANYAVQSVAMFMGILTFVCVYVYVESREWTRRKLMDKSLRIAVRVGYITRVAISVLFPVAMFVDLWCGLVSVSIMSRLFGETYIGSGSRGSTPVVAAPIVLSWFYFTTLLQGLLLNVVLGAYTLIVYALVLLFRKR